MAPVGSPARAPLVARDYPPGLIGVVAQDQARYSWFAESLSQLHLPPGTQAQPLWQIGASIAANCNALIRRMPPHCGWIQLWADDHRFDPETLLRLLAHDVPIVAPLCCLRRPPFLPSLFRQSPEGLQPLTWEDLAGQHGLYPVAATGGPGVVIQRAVLDAIGDPWYECLPGAREAPNEDLAFAHKVTAAGYTYYVDLDTRIEHITPMSLRPYQDVQGQWQVAWWSYGARGTLLPHLR